MIAIILMLDIYNHSLRVRLPQFQKYYKRGFYVVMAVLVFNTSLIVFHKALFYLLDDPSKHFAYRIYKPYYLAKELKLEGIECYNLAEKRERYQLKYYNIHPCQD